MGFDDHDNVRLTVDEDRLSSLPDELIHEILSRSDIKFVVQTCLLSWRWKLLWTSIPYLNFSCMDPDSSRFAKFVTNVLSRRDHRGEVSSVKLDFHRKSRAASQVTEILNYVFSRNLKTLTIYFSPERCYEVPPCLFSSLSLEHFTFRSSISASNYLTLKTPWNFPALTSLHISDIILRDGNPGRQPFDMFSKCVNLKNLTLKHSFVVVDVLDIISPRLVNLSLIDVILPNVVNVIAPQLENITVIDCSIEYLNAPPGISSFCYKDRYRLLQLPKDGFHSLNKVIITLKFGYSFLLYREEDACRAIKMLQELRSARFLTLNSHFVEWLSSFPALLSQLPSPFSNLVCLNICSSYKLEMSIEVRNFLLGKSPGATVIMEPLTQQ